MRIKFIYIIITLTLMSCSFDKGEEIRDIAKEYNVSSVIENYEPYLYDTLLSKGYYLSYKVFLDSFYDYHKMQSLTLMNNGVKIKEISGCSHGLIHKNLGYIINDFDSLFLFGQSFGSGNPHLIALIEKSSGNESLRAFYTDLKGDILLYNTFEKDSLPHELRVLDLKTNLDIPIKEFDNYNYAYDEDYFADGKEIDSVSTNNYWLSFESTKGKILKKYNR